MARKNRYPRIQIRQLPILLEGGSIDPKTTTGGFAKTSGTMGAIGGAATTLLAPVAQAGKQQNPYQNYVAGNSGTQQTVDALASMIPGVGQIYSAGKQIGQIAENDYAAQNEYGELADTGKFKVADTISTFIDPLGSFISGVSGEGWTANQRADITNDKGAANRRQVEQQKAAEYKKREIDAGYGGRYQDQLLQAKEGGPLNNPNGFNGQGMDDYANGGTLRSIQDTNYFRWSSNPTSYAMGGAMAPNGPQVSNTPAGKIPQITEYGAGGTHAESPNGGVPVDAQGNVTAVSQQSPVALTEQGEISWVNPKTKQAYVFSNAF